ncbi:geranylgeranyl reductase family protein [Mesonia aestuariivivens]|uniref:Geranylgeranyl reductase family protein n=1 Tax=Mesonia aestuariivivens TaxID=2796128 RepID=A0ABS6W4D9_9FLAO|nr:geranylgeranyl reductase family protein [Mesonia aestuariivivens]MBW2962351.1 geranylgeranyl reductase family protein [Mesonia aestuariivivens]
MNKMFDVAVIGSGPSGAIAAYESAKNGLKTILIEKETLPRYKTCGGGFVYRGLKNMPFSVDKAIDIKFNEVTILFGAKNLSFKTKREKPIISMVMRDQFDHLIVKKSQAEGVELFENAKVQNLVFHDNYTQIETSQGNIAAKFIIAADGALSPTAKLAGWEETRRMSPALEYEITVSDETFKKLAGSARFDIDAAPQGYGWCFPKANHLSVGVGNFKKSSKKVNLKKAYQEYLKLLGIDKVLSEEAHGFIIPTSPRTDGFVKKNVFLTGDAAGFADPITAEGISNAIASGVMAAQAIVESQLNIEQAKALYLDKVNKKLLPELETGIKLAKFFYGQKKLRNILLKKHGQRAAEYMTNIFMGDSTYPQNFYAKVKQKLKITF